MGQENSLKRQPDLVVHSPADIWILADDETVPLGFGFFTTDQHVTIIFKLHKENNYARSEFPQSGTIVH